MATESLQFSEFHKPALESGSYTISVEQDVKTGKPKGSNAFNSPVLNFAVLGERFSMDPASIHAMFPPAGSLGKNTDCLPHISMTHSTFPWERSAYGGDDEEPWLALLLFDETEIQNEEVVQQIINLGEIKTKEVLLADGTAKTPKFPDITLEIGQNATDPATVIDVKQSLLEQIMPSGAELKLLAHVRKRTNAAAGATVIPLAVVVGNRMPKEGAESTVHLVSVEGRYKTKGEKKTFNYQAIFKITEQSLKNLKSKVVPDDVLEKLKGIKDQEVRGEEKFLALLKDTIGEEQTDKYKSLILKHANDDFIRLVSLKSWSFACFPPAANNASNEGKNFDELVNGIDAATFRFPNTNPSSPIEPYADAGYLPLSHKLRQCDETWSWYHGPLTAGDVAPEFTTESNLPDFADALIRYHTDIGMFDTAYAAAFELGRAMAVRDDLFSTALYQWKQNCNEDVTSLVGPSYVTVFY